MPITNIMSFFVLVFVVCPFLLVHSVIYSNQRMKATSVSPISASLCLLPVFVSVLFITFSCFGLFVTVYLLACSLACFVLFCFSLQSFQSFVIIKYPSQLSFNSRSLLLNKHALLSFPILLTSIVSLHPFFSTHMHFFSFSFYSKFPQHHGKLAKI